MSDWYDSDRYGPEREDDDIPYNSEDEEERKNYFAESEPEEYDEIEYDEYGDVLDEFSKFIAYIELNDLKNVKKMIDEKRVDPSQNDSFALDRAIFMRNIDIVKLLLQDPRVDPSARENQALETAINRNFSKVIPLLLADPRVDPMSQALLEYVVTKNDIELLELLLADERFDPSEFGNIMILNAVVNGHHDIVIMLLEDGRADPTATNNTPLYDAIENNDERMVELLLSDARVRNSHPEDTLFIDTAGSIQNNDKIVKMILGWYLMHNIPVNVIIEHLPPYYQKYVLLYYDIDSIPEEYEFKLYNNPEDIKIVQNILPRYEYDPEKKVRFLRRIGFNPRYRSTLSALTKEGTFPVQPRSGRKPGPMKGAGRRRLPVRGPDGRFIRRGASGAGAGAIIPTRTALPPRIIGEISKFL
jgi:ankyrin repeat protein